MNTVFVITVGDIIAGVLFGLLLLFVLFLFLKEWVEQTFCSHEKYYENMRCEAICSKCRKNLGFIGTVREERKNDPRWTKIE